MKRLISSLIFFLLAVSVSINIRVQPARAVDTIYIRADGSIEPPTASIASCDNETYTFTGDIVVEGDGVIVERYNVVVDGNAHTLLGNGSGCGIKVSSGNVTVTNVTIAGFNIGIGFAAFSTNRVYSNDIIARTGVRAISSYNSSIFRNNITSQSYGIDIYLGHYNDVYENTVTNSSAGICVVAGSGSNSIFSNNVTNCGAGLYIGDGARENRFYGNNVVNNSLGCLLLANGESNSLYHNNFINNTAQAEVATAYYPLAWDDGYPSGGNYWSDYFAWDMFSGSYQNETGSDGIGDLPYVIDPQNQDRYPFAPPRIFGDVNGDGYVGVDDIYLVASHFAAELGDPEYSRMYDLNSDGYIGIDDILFVALHFGGEEP